MLKRGDPEQKNLSQGQNVNHEQNRNPSGQVKDNNHEQANDSAQNHSQNKNHRGLGKAQNQSQNTGQAHGYKQGRPFRNSGYNRNQAQNYGQKKQSQQADAVMPKEGRKNARNKDLQTRSNNTSHLPYNRYDASRPKIEETVENIQEDILRIEKEIELEIKEIKGLKL